MLCKLKMTLELSNCSEFGINKSSLLHGVIMDYINVDYAEYLHESALKPYSQNLSRDKDGKWVWTISTLNEEAYNNIILPLLDVDSFIIKHNDLLVGISSKEIIKSDYNDLFESNYFESDISNYVTFDITTPVSFKANGRYINYPDAVMLVTNLMHKYDSFSPSTEIYDERLIEELQHRLIISAYDLRSTIFCVEGVKIPSFNGIMTIRVNGSSNIVSLVNMLADYSEFSGVGIKTALGMGAVTHRKIINRKGKSNERKQS